MKSLISTLALFLLLFSQANALEISNFKSGLTCSDGEKPTDVCFETEDVYVTGQGNCVWNGKIKPCTWYGFSFDYKKAEPGTELVCKAIYSKNIVGGNPKEVLNNGAMSEEFKIKLNEESGHYFNPQYYLFSGYASSIFDSSVRSEISCSFKEKKVFEYTIKAHFPVK